MEKNTSSLCGMPAKNAYPETIIIRKHQTIKKGRFYKIKLLIHLKNVNIMQNKENLRNYFHNKGE